MEEGKNDKERQKRRRRMRKRRNMDKGAKQGVIQAMTVWKQFQLGISNLEVYPENSQVVDDVLQKLATDK